MMMTVSDPVIQKLTHILKLQKEQVRPFAVTVLDAMITAGVRESDLIMLLRERDKKRKYALIPLPLSPASIAPELRRTREQNRILVQSVFD